MPPAIPITTNCGPSASGRCVGIVRAYKSVKVRLTIMLRYLSRNRAAPTFRANYSDSERSIVSSLIVHVRGVLIKVSIVAWTV